MVGDAAHIALAVHREQGPPLIGGKGHLAALGRALGQAEPQVVVRHDLADGDDLVPLDDGAIEQLVEVPGEVRHRGVAPGDELKVPAVQGEDRAERRLTDVIAGRRRHQAPAVEAERAGLPIVPDLELAGLTGGSEELHDGLDREVGDLSS